MLILNHLVGFGAKRGGGSVVQIAQGTGSTIGNMIENGGLAAAFDSTTSQAQAACAYKTGAAGTVGKDFTTTRNVVRWLAWGSSDVGFNNQAGNGACTVSLEYSSDGVSFSTADSVSVNAIPGTVDRTFASVGAYRYWQVKIDDGAVDARCAEVQFWEQT